MDSGDLQTVRPLHGDGTAAGRPRILIVRLSAMGDVIHGMPVLTALRDALPQSFLAWVVEGAAGDLLEGHPALDELIRVPRRWLKSPREVWRLRRRLRELQIDVTVDLQSLTKSSIAARLSGAPRRIGAGGTDGRELSRFFNNELVNVRAGHVIEHYLQLLRPLGIKSPRVRFDLPEQPGDAAGIEPFLHRQRLEPGMFVLLNPGAGWPSKLWPAERYGQVARHLFVAHGLRGLAVWAGDEERQMAETIVAHSDRRAVMAPATSMRELAALARRAALFIGSDTGPLHLAVTVGTPAISLHGPSRAEWCGAYGPQNVRLQVRYEEGTATERRRADNAAMRAISVAMVCDACDRVLGRRELRRLG